MINLKAYQKLFLLLPFFFSLQCINGAPNISSKTSPLTTAQLLWSKGNDAFQKHDYNNSLLYLRKALPLFEEQQQWGSYVLVLCKIAENLDKLEEFEEMKRASQRAVNVGCEFLKEEDKALGQAYHLLGESYWVEAIFNNFALEERQALLKKAIHNFDIAENVFQTGGHWENLLENHLNMGFIRVHLGDDLENAEGYLKTAVDLVQTKFPVEDSLKHITLSQAYSSLMKIHQYFSGDFDKALKYAHLALEHRLQLPNKLSKDKLWLAGKYLKIGLVHTLKRDHEQAFLYFQKAEKLVVDLKPSAIKEHIYHSLGYIYFYKSLKSTVNQLEEDTSNLKIIQKKAIEYAQKAREIVESSDFTPKKQQDVLRCKAYRFLASTFFQSQNGDSAIYWMNKAEKYNKYANNIYQHTSFLSEKKLLDVYFHQAIFQKSNNQLDAAIHTMKPCIENITNKTVNEFSSWWCNFMGKAYIEKRDYPKALDFFQKSLFSLCYNQNISSGLYENPSIEETIFKTAFLQTLHYKAKTLHELYFLENQDLVTLEAAFNTYKTAIESIEIVRQDYLTEGVKQVLTEKNFSIFEEAIVIALQLYDITKDSYYQEQAFLFSEKSKVNLLMDAISDQQLKTVYLSDSLLQKEKQVKIDLTFYKRLLYEKKASTIADRQKMGIWKEKIFQLEREKELFHQTLKREYPDYFELKYSSKTIELKDIQKTLSKNQAFIEFFWGEENLYAFVIPPNQTNTPQIQTFKLGKTSTLKEQILMLIEHHQNPNCSFQDYVKNSHQLYLQLLKPILSKWDKKAIDLMIVPDGMLGYIPFEALIMELPNNKTQTNYSIRNLAYLIRNFQVSYTYSASLSLKQESIMDLLKSSFEKEKTLLAYAPSFYGAYDGLLVRSCANTLSELRCAKTEVQNLEDNWNGKALLGEQATKEHFVEQATKCDILHLATHACMDDNNPNFNRIYFANNEYLTSLELYALQLKSQLTVLSACNTASGQLVKGEGIMSLARGFMAAGCPSLITTLWGVNDCTTQNLMTSFYKHLYSGKQKDEALRNAKIAYLNDQETTSADSHPFYWAAFVQLGDNRAIFEKESPIQSMWIYGFLGVLLGSFVFFVTRKE